METILVRSVSRSSSIDRSSRPWSSISRNRSRAPVRCASELPGDQVAVVLQHGEQDLVARAQVAHPPRVRHQVQPLGGAARPDELRRVGDPQQRRHLLPRVVVRVRGAVAELVDAAVHVGVVALVVRRDGVDHRPRLLRAGRVVQVDDRLAVRRLAQDRKVLADALHVQRGGRCVGEGMLIAIRAIHPVRAETAPRFARVATLHHPANWRERVTRPSLTRATPLLTQRCTAQADRVVVAANSSLCREPIPRPSEPPGSSETSSKESIAWMHIEAGSQR